MRAVVAASGERGVLDGAVRTPSTVDGVVDRLATAIALGEFLPGERLPAERDLAALLGVGRGSVRDALDRLRRRGLVEIHRGRLGGAFVRTDWTDGSAGAVRSTLRPAAADLRALSDLRCLVEGMIARTAAARRGDPDIAAIAEAVERFERAERPAEAHRADAELHRVITLAAGNPYLPELSRQLLGTLTSGIPIEPYTDRGHRQALSEHRLLAEAVIDGRADDAEAIAFRHFQITTDAVRSVLRRGGGAGAPEDNPANPRRGADDAHQ
jgi:GntR family transcriptional regulator, transcriptional repressor for pyruvate dehydrogenase complex